MFRLWNILECSAVVIVVSAHFAWSVLLIVITAQAVIGLFE